MCTGEGERSLSGFKDGVRSESFHFDHDYTYPFDRRLYIDNISCPTSTGFSDSKML